MLPKVRHTIRPPCVADGRAVTVVQLGEEPLF